MPVRENAPLFILSLMQKMAGNLSLHKEIPSILNLWNMAAGDQ